MITLVSDNKNPNYLFSTDAVIKTIPKDGQVAIFNFQGKARKPADYLKRPDIVEWTFTLFDFDEPFSTDDSNSNDEIVEMIGEMSYLTDDIRKTVMERQLRGDAEKLEECSNYWYPSLEKFGAC